MFDTLPLPGKIALVIGLGIVAFKLMLLWQWHRGQIHDDLSDLDDNVD